MFKNFRNTKPKDVKDYVTFASVQDANGRLIARGGKRPIPLHEIANRHGLMFSTPIDRTAVEEAGKRAMDKALARLGTNVVASAD